VVRRDHSWYRSLGSWVRRATGPIRLDKTVIKACGPGGLLKLKTPACDTVPTCDIFQKPEQHKDDKGFVHSMDGSKLVAAGLALGSS